MLKLAILWSIVTAILQFSGVINWPLWAIAGPPAAVVLFGVVCTIVGCSCLLAATILERISK